MFYGHFRAIAEKGILRYGKGIIINPTVTHFIPGPVFVVVAVVVVVVVVVVNVPSW